jgi:multidrug efflux pump subunit AcrA (membrane-fusion protein)
MKLWWLAGGAAVVLAATAVTAVVLTGDEKPAPVEVSTVKVTRGEVSATVSASGTAQAQASRSLGFTSTGTITELNVKAGDVVAVGTVLARIDDSNAQDAVDQASDSVSSAEDALDKAQEAHDAALATPSATTTTAAPSSGGGAQTGTQGSAQSRAGQIQQTSDNLMNAQQRLNNARLSLTQANTRLAGTVITAPVAGKVLAVNGTVGGQAGSGVITLAGDGDVVVKAQFTEAEVARLKVGQVAKITLPDDVSAKYDGKVMQIDPAGTASNQLVRYATLISFDKVPESLLYGQSATVAVVTASVDNVLSVPSAVVHNGHVTVRVAGTDEERAVETGLRGDVNTEVKSGLAEGDLIVTAGR